MPPLGDVDAVDVIEVLVKPGDRIEQESPLITLESDKASMDVPASEAGQIKEVLVKVGDQVKEGDPIVRVEAVEAEAETEPEAAPSEPPAETTAPEQAEAPPQPESQVSEAPQPKAEKGEIQEIRVPPLGDVDVVDVIEVLVKPGDRVEQESPLITLESDKASMDVPSPEAGQVEEVMVKVGDQVKEGDLIVRLAAAGAAVEPEAAAEEAPPAQPEPAVPAQAEAAPEAAAPAPAPTPQAPAAKKAPEGVPPYASPSVRKFARKLGVDLQQVEGSGPKGRILKEDVEEFVKSRLQKAPAEEGIAGIPAVPEIDFSKFGPVESMPLSRLKRLTGPHLQRAWLNAPQVTQHHEVDITELEEFRQSLKGEAERRKVKLTPLAFMLKALPKVLKEFPNFNASLAPDGQSLLLKQYCHIGVAVATPDGLVVPVVRDVDRKGVWALAEELAEVSARARAGKLKPDDLQGGCFSVSSLGGIGGSFFTPIVNVPEVAILGLSRARMQPVWDGSQFAPRLMLPISLSYDHRVIDGAEGAQFVVRYGELLGDLRQLVL
ncbi:dihydrolipoyllysine-residue acetyltransferase [Methylohalobius crimeensis]|uniref:dihydrolipoyllysine-residue acetyltransferase n=1 Tax=Methylohalobius crimeensis TaxID=244365 RepID=UPI0003F89300|nr:dihydrolipoyllysine-residue acetyltransferase [Methylohalobius crimeensis]